MVVRDVVLSRRHRSGGRSEHVGDLFAVISLKLIIGLNYVLLYTLIGLVLSCLLLPCTILLSFCHFVIQDHLIRFGGGAAVWISHWVQRLCFLSYFYLHSAAGIKENKGNQYSSNIFTKTNSNVC